MGLHSSRVDDRTDEGRLLIRVGDLTVIETRPTNWRAASTRVGSVETPGARRGLRRSAGQPRRVPQGEIHAYEVGSSAAACGRSLDDLHRWDDVPFASRLLNCCRDCLDRTRGD